MIAVDGVTKRYGPLVAVDDLTFEVGRGEVVGFLWSRPLQSTSLMTFGASASASAAAVTLSRTLRGTSSAARHSTIRTSGARS